MKLPTRIGYTMTISTKKRGLDFRRGSTPIVGGMIPLCCVLIHSLPVLAQGASPAYSPRYPKDRLIDRQPGYASLENGWNPDPLFKNGRLVFAHLAPTNSYAPYSLVIRDLAAQGGENARLVQGVDIACRNPEFAPDGQTVLFRAMGTEWYFDEFASFSLYRFDFKERFLLKGIQEPLGSENIKSSRDGRYLAYIRGVMKNGIQRDPGKPIQLVVMDLTNGKVSPVASGPIAPSFAWTSQGTLLFTRPQAKRQQVPGVQIWRTAPQNVFETNFHTAPKLVLESGSRPNPSPNNQFMVYRGYLQAKPPKLPDKAAGQKTNEMSVKESAGPGTYIFNRSDGQRAQLPERFFNSLYWTPNGKNLIAVDTGYTTTGEGGGYLRVLNMDSQNIQSWKLPDAKDLKYIESHPTQYELLSFSADSEVAYLAISSWGSIDPADGIFSRQVQVVAVDLQNGKQATLTTLNNPKGVDFWAGK